MSTASTRSSFDRLHVEAISEIKICDLVRDRISLSQWLEHKIEAQWQDPIDTSKRVAIATRGSISHNEISDTIEKLKFSNDQKYRHQLIQKLGFIADGNRDAVKTLIELGRFCGLD